MNAAAQDGAKDTGAITFHTTVWQMGNNTAIQVPDEVIQRLGPSKRPLVRMTINHRYSYRSAVAVMDAQYLVSLSAENRKAANVQGGDEVEVTIELDLEPRLVEIPEDLKVALIEAGILAAFEKSAPSMRKEYVRQVEEAKAQETRQRRIAKILEKLSGAA